MLFFRISFFVILVSMKKKKYDLFCHQWPLNFTLIAFFLVATACSLQAFGQVSNNESHATQLGIGELIQEALKNNPQIRSQEANNRSADADVDVAKWQFFPTPSVSVEQASTQSQDPTYANGAQVRYVRFQQPLYTWGRLTAGLSKAQARKLIAVASLDESRQQIAFRVIQSYVEWYSAWLKQQAFIEGSRDHQRFKDLIVRRIEAGVSPSSDLLLVQSRIEQMQSDLLSASSQQGIAKIKLSQLLGRPVNSITLQTMPQIEVKGMLIRSAVDWGGQAEKVNPSLMRLTAQAEVARLELAERRSSMMPEIYVRAEYQSGSPYTTRSQADQTRIFIGFSSNIGAGLSGLATLNSSKEKYESTLEDLDSGKRNLQEQVMSELNSLQSTSDRYNFLGAAHQLAQELVAGGERQFLAGRKSWQELMNTSRELIQAKTQLADTQASLLQSAWRLSLLSDDLNEVLKPKYFLKTTP